MATHISPTTEVTPALPMLLPHSAALSYWARIPDLFWSLV